ncbi:NUDIX hydrolase [Micromonospora sp. 4G55]|uniref:NUDIX domain-containing protein n=1 Tax=Micromonospora sp. 4G55 TaxID=2806102 RepID=UPI001A53D600|nr:NUDIX hydrolase [Micromonospora sp. 4G55]MBM0256507.1 NUDIX hydrolase [Micromonospora sp. 4G55]
MTDVAIDPDLEYIANVTRVRAAAGAVLLDGAGRVLVVHPTYKDVWEVPGGMLEPGESPLQACEREIEEELGLGLSVGDLLCVDWVPPSPPWDGGLMFVFDGGVLGPEQIDSIRLRSEELDRMRFIEPAALGQVLIPRLAQRVVQALAARARGGGVYLENGLAVSR